MLGTKVEITLPKAEPGTWSQLYFATKKPTEPTEPKGQVPTIEKPKIADNDSDSDTDLDAIEQVRGVKITEA